MTEPEIESDGLSPAQSSLPLESGMKARTGVYALRFVNGMYYVGQSSDIDRCIQQHALGAVACTAGWGSGCVEEQLLTSHADAEFAERNEMLERVQKYGIDKVRGWIFTEPMLSEESVEFIESLLCEKYDVCAQCGGTGHFRGACPAEK